MRKMFAIIVVMLGCVFTINAQDASLKEATSVKQQTDEVKKDNEKTAKAESAVLSKEAKVTKEAKAEPTLSDEEIKNARKENATLREDKE